MVSSKKTPPIKVQKPKAPPLVIEFSMEIGKAKQPENLPKPKTQQLELDMDQLSGSLNTMQFTSVNRNKLPSPVKQNPKERVKSPVAPPVAAVDLNGAAGLWAKDEVQVECFKEPEPKVEPPPMTEEDWEIFKPFMNLPQPPPPCYNKLLEMKTQLLVTNQEEFVCPICESFIVKAEGVVLKSCLHNFCRLCLIDVINTSHDMMGQVRCPFPIVNCEFPLEDVEVKALLGDDFDEFALKVMQTLQEQMRQEEASKFDTLPRLLNADNVDVIENYEVFECEICYTEAEIGDGAILKNCLHKFCKLCLIESIKHSDEFAVKCPESSCEFTLQEREIRGLVPIEIFDKHLEKSLKLYQGVSETAVHCKTPDCRGWIEADKNVRGFTCEVCEKVNCIGCKAIHQGKNCQEYQDVVNPDGRHKRENEESENTIKNMITGGEAMYCPRCGIPVMKQDGCDFITCTTCKLGICWVTKKPRQPIRKEDGTIIDGCHCKEKNGKPCHPNCRHCH